MLCPGCNKFAANCIDTEPEVSVEIDNWNLSEATETDAAPDAVETPTDSDETPITGTVSVSGNVRIVITSECCGEELKEANFDFSEDVEITRASDCTCSDDPQVFMEGLETDVAENELTERQQSETVTIAKRGPNKGKEVRKLIPYRYRRNYYGCAVGVVVNCGCGKEVGKHEFTDEIAAGSMDELN